jgi:hypothetical protein
MIPKECKRLAEVDFRAKHVRNTMPVEIFLKV